MSVHACSKQNLRIFQPCGVRTRLKVYHPPTKLTTCLPSCGLLVRAIELAMQTALSSPKMADVMADVANYTNIAPVMQVSEVVGS